VVKFKCMNLESGVATSCSYLSPYSGKSYIFSKGCFKNVIDERDVKWFSEACGGSAFKTEDFLLSNVKKVVGVVKEKLGLVKETEKMFSEQELIELNRSGQVSLIFSLSGSRDVKVPRTEKGRVSLILELQKQKNGGV
jgi:hypothetical protein